jgi:superfamily I DNA/RNA helicase
VIFPDITFDAKGSDGIQELTYDTRDRHLPIKHFVDRIAGYWWERSGSGNPNLTPTECRQIVESIRPGFDFRPSLRARADRANDELLRLTSQQITVLEGLIENERSIVSGGAGTGKTLLAVEEARRQARAGSSVLLTCFSRGLASFLADVCSDCQGITVRHLHGILWDLVEEAGLQDDVAGASPDDLFSLFLPAAALKGLEQLGDRHRFDVLIVDEAQDLLIETYIEVFDALLRGGLHDGLWKIFLDAAQDLFTGIDHSQFALLTNARPGRFRLAVNCRNTEQIAVTSAILSSTDLIDARTSGPSTETHYFRDEADLRRKVARILNRLFSEQFETEAVTILSTRKLEATGLETVLPDTRVKLFDASDQRWDFTAGPNSVSFRTVASFKGLESDVVVLIGDNRIGTATGRVDMYVGTTRARVLLIVLLPESARDVCESLQIDFGERLAEVARHDSV